MQQIGPLAGDVAGSVDAAALLVGGGEKDDVPGQRDLAAREFDQRQELHDADALRVDRAASDDEVALPSSSIGGALPRLGIGGHRVEMGEQDQWGEGAAAAQASPGRRAPNL